MGVPDYISFIQRNGQCLVDIEPSHLEENDPEGEMDRKDWESDTCGLHEAILVKVPKSFSKDELARWYPQQFESYPSFKTGYSWDNWGFEFEENDEERQYGEAISEGVANDGVWESSHHPGVWLVVFTPKEYDTFVMGEETDPKDISYSYYNQVFEERMKEFPDTKEEAFEMIVENFNPPPTKSARFRGVEHRRLPAGGTSDLQSENPDRVFEPAGSAGVESKLISETRPIQSGDFVDISLNRETQERYQVHSIISGKI